METQFSHQLKVGLFVALGLVSVMASILALGGDRAFFKSFSRIHASLPQVQGLSKGSVVSLAGVTVGNIENIDFSNQDNSLRVTMKVESSYLDKIPTDSTVETRTQGALGDKYIYIIQGNMAGPKVKAGDHLQPSKSTDLMGVISERGGEAEQIFDIINELKKILVAINADNKVDRIVTNLAETSVNLKQISQDAKVVIADLKNENPQKVRKILTQLDSILAKIDRGEGTLGALVNDSSLHESLKNFVGTSPRKKYMQSVIRNTLEKSDGAK